MPQSPPCVVAVAWPGRFYFAKKHSRKVRGGSCRGRSGGARVRTPELPLQEPPLPFLEILGLLYVSLVDPKFFKFCVLQVSLQVILLSIYDSKFSKGFRIEGHSFLEALVAACKQI